MRRYGRVGGYATNTKSRGRYTNVFRKRLSTPCMAWSSYHTGPRTIRGERVSLFREPDAGNLPVRFDEREQETEPSQTGLR